MLSSVSSFRFLLFLFQFQQHISQFLQDLRSTKGRVMVSPQATRGATEHRGPSGKGSAGTVPGLPVGLFYRKTRPRVPGQVTTGGASLRVVIVQQAHLHSCRWLFTQRTPPFTRGSFWGSHKRTPFLVLTEPQLGGPQPLPAWAPCQS